MDPIVIFLILRYNNKTIKVMTNSISRVITHSHETLSTVIYDLLSDGKISPEVCDDLITSVLNTNTKNIY